jgi:hypothetical protein
MPDPIMLAVATALAVNSAEATVTGGRSVLRSLVNLVRRRFGADADALRAIDTVDPRDQESVRTLANELDRVAAADPAFGAQVRSLWADLDDNAVVSSNFGTVNGALLQGRDFTFEGGLNLGNLPERQ